MYTANKARAYAANTPNKLDEQLKLIVENAIYHGLSHATIRVFSEDAWFGTIAQELEKRGFTVNRVPDMVMKGDVEFSW